MRSESSAALNFCFELKPGFFTPLLISGIVHETEAELAHFSIHFQLVFPKVNLLIHFGLYNATRSSPVVKFFTAQGVASELRYAAREFFQRDDGMHVDLAKRTVYLSRVIKW